MSEPREEVLDFETRHLFAPSYSVMMPASYPPGLAGFPGFSAGPNQSEFPLRRGFYNAEPENQISPLEVYPSPYTQYEGMAPPTPSGIIRPPKAAEPQRRKSAPAIPGSRFPWKGKNLTNMDPKEMSRKVDDLKVELDFLKKRKDALLKEKLRLIEQCHQYCCQTLSLQGPQSALRL
ncbi:hypothetical protein OQA88_6241 [Cercophora sp. LCS_1]